MAAGLGFKTFTTGEVLTAADTNGYLMQGVLVFASAAARDAAITSPQEGQFAYLKDTNVTTYYTGSAWANLDTTGMTNPMTTTGDTIYSSSGSTPARLGIGSTGQVLTVAGGIPSWATPSSGASFSGAQARNSSSQSITNNTETAIIFDSEIFDSGTYWDTGSNTRFTVPSTGKYSISVSVLFNYSVAGYQTIKIYKNGAFAYQVDRVGFTGTSSNAFSLGKTSLISLTASDYVEAFYYQNSGSTQTIFGNTSDTGCMQWSINYLGA